MKKRILSILLVVVMVLSLVSIPAFAADGDVEITFCVGDDTLLINGAEVKVVTPYVVGAGVTLVPVRVITEAFGAKVDWVAETETVLLTYPDVNISLQIGNPVAEINGRAETLLAAPELTNSSTMVPLRFISENFGAEVSYDEETEKITVLKKGSESGGLVEGVIDSKFIGDSYYGWSMENPTDMQMEDRSFDGEYTVFSYDDENWMFILIEVKDKDYDFEEDFKEGKSSMTNYTLVKADKDTSNSKQKVMHFQVKNKTIFQDIYKVETEKYLFSVHGRFENDEEDIKNEAIRIMSTFKLGFSKNDTYDLSDVENGVRRFEVESMKISFDVPEEFSMTSDEDAETSVVFDSREPYDGRSRIALEIYSKESVESAEALAKLDYSRNKKTFNETITTFFEEDVVQKTYAGMETYTYSYEYKPSDGAVFSRDTFFEIGDYVYNLSVHKKLPLDDKEAYVDKILNSIEAKELDSSVVGDILYNSETPDDTVVADDLRNCTMEIPSWFQKVQASDTEVAYLGGYILLCNMFTDRTYNYSDITAILKNMESSVKSQKGVTITQVSRDVTIGKIRFVKCGYKVVDPDTNATVYTEMYATTRGGVAYMFVVEIPEIMYSEAHKEEIKNILSSIQFK